MRENIMRTVIAATAIVMVSLIALGQGFAQTWSQPYSYDRCAALASRQGLSANSRSGRAFISRCMQRGSYERGTYGRSRNCPDDPKARSAFPAWMCP
jgi:hypothetical protein